MATLPFPALGYQIKLHSLAPKAPEDHEGHGIPCATRVSAEVTLNGSAALSKKKPRVLASLPPLIKGSFRREGVYLAYNSKSQSIAEGIKAGT